MGICCSWGIFLFWHELLEHGPPRKEIPEHVLHSHVDISPAALEVRQPQGPASVRPPQLRCWKLELFGHQLFPVLRENNKQANKTKQKIRFLFGSHQLLRTVVFTREKLEKVSLPFQIAKQAAQSLRLQYCQGRRCQINRFSASLYPPCSVKHLGRCLYHRRKEKNGECCTFDASKSPITHQTTAA